MQNHASSETVFDDLELFRSLCHWLRKISNIQKIRHHISPLGDSSTVNVSEINNEIFQRKNTFTAETNVHEFESVETRYDSYISGNCCCFSWCITQVVYSQIAFFAKIISVGTFTSITVEKFVTSKNFNNASIF